MTDDPIDAFDKIADDIRQKEDELDAADKLRSDKAAERRKRKPGESTDAAVDAPERPKTD